MKIKKNKGITLLALTITIIILLILAGIIISTTIGVDGIFSKARIARQEYLNAEEYEKTKMNEISSQISERNLPSNTSDTPAGTQVKTPNGWYTTQPAEISTQDGRTVEQSVKVASVYAVATGGGETVPVPKGFYYVGGNTTTGVIISDNVADQYDGVHDKTAFSYTTSLVGNQFVWIPCDVEHYVKTDWNTELATERGETDLQSCEWDTSTPGAELVQIKKYGGFYVARYEAGLASDMSEDTSTKQEGAFSGYNVYKTPQSKAGLIPWNFIDWTHAKKNAESMYSNSSDNVTSGLITGTQFDVILNTLVDKKTLTKADLIDGSSWANIKSNSIAFTGKKASLYKSNGNYYLDAFGSTTTSTTTNYSSNSSPTGDLLTTGASAVCEKYHIFDIGGNLFEKTEEDSHKSTTGQYSIMRAARCCGNENPCFRNGNSITNANSDEGFRVVLYIK